MERSLCLGYSDNMNKYRYVSQQPGDGKEVLRGGLEGHQEGLTVVGQGLGVWGRYTKLQR